MAAQQRGKALTPLGVQVLFCALSVIVVQQAAAILFVRWTYSTQNEFPF